jgi:hypothetical protein
LVISFRQQIWLQLDRPRNKYFGCESQFGLKGMAQLREELRKDEPRVDHQRFTLKE